MPERSVRRIAGDDSISSGWAGSSFRSRPCHFSHDISGGAGLATGAALGPHVLLCYVAVTAINLGYSFGGRDARGVDRGHGRPTLLRYTDSQLKTVVAVCLGAGAGIALMDVAEAPGFYAVLWATTTVLIGGAYLSEAVRGVLRSIWTH